MKRAETSSWSLTAASPQLLHVALFVRDCVSLPVPDDAAGPPRLAGELPDLRHVLTDDERVSAGRQWPSWWAALIGHELAGRDRPSGADVEGWLRRRLAELERLADAPEFASFSDRPQLRAALVATFEQAVRWESAAKGSRMNQPNAPFEWQLVRDAAEDVAFDRGVEPGELDGLAIILPVEGSWSQLLGGGAALCSPAVAADPSAAYALLRAVFLSGLH